MKRTFLLLAGSALLAVATAACGDGRPSRMSSALLPPEVRDSAGVHIVENRIPPNGVPVYGTVDPVPTMDLGVPAGGDPHFVFNDVRGAQMLSDGGAAVADAGSFQVRYFGKGGEYVGKVGSPGSDVGKFLSIWQMGRFAGDTLWVFDGRAGRLSVLDPDGSIGRTARMPGMSPWGRFGDGSFLMAPPWSMAEYKRRPVEGLRRDTATYVRWWPSNGTVDTVGTFPQNEILVADTGGVVMAAVPPFGRRTSAEVGPGRFYVGDQNTFEVRGYDPDGTLREIIRLPGTNLALSKEEAEELHARVAQDRPESAWLKKLWAQVPATRPAYSRLLLDGLGNLWVAEFVAVADFPRNWMVFAPDGSLAGIVSLPTHFAPFEIGVGSILGLSIEPPGVEHVRRYNLKRGG